MQSYGTTSRSLLGVPHIVGQTEADHSQTSIRSPTHLLVQHGGVAVVQVKHKPHRRLGVFAIHKQLWQAARAQAPHS